MSRFKNATKGDLWLQGPDGGRIKIKERGEFHGSNYYKRYTVDALGPDEALLFILEDDHSPWSLGTIPNVIHSWEFSVGTTDTFNQHEYHLAKLLGADAVFLQIVADEEPVNVRLNKEDKSIFRMDANSQQTFNTNELLVSTVEFAHSDLAASGAKIRMLAATSIKN